MHVKSTTLRQHPQHPPDNLATTTTCECLVGKEAVIASTPTSGLAQMGQLQQPKRRPFHMASDTLDRLRYVMCSTSKNVSAPTSSCGNCCVDPHNSTTVVIVGCGFFVSLAILVSSSYSNSAHIPRRCEGTPLEKEGIFPRPLQCLCFSIFSIPSRSVRN